MKKDKKTKTITTTELTLDGADIEAMLIRANYIKKGTECSVTFHVPGGGDYCNQTLEIDDDCPIRVVCVETKEL